MRRAAISVAANIAEGSKKQTRRDQANFYNIGQGSLEELRYYVLLCQDLQYLPDAAGPASKLDEVARMLHALVAASRSPSHKPKL
jgi:four helix bundle protein